MANKSQTSLIAEKKAFLLYADMKPLIDRLSVDQAGHFIKLVFSYQNSVDYHCEDQLVLIAFEFIKAQFTRDEQRYEKRCKRKAEVKARYAKPDWQKRRLEIMARDGFSCVKCGDSKSELNVHHSYYLNKTELHAYSDSALITLCKSCHEKEHSLNEVTL